MDLEDILDELGATEKGWSTDGFGIDSNLICPHGHMIEQDGRCPEGCVSPLREAGII